MSIMVGVLLIISTEYKRSDISVAPFMFIIVLY
jgi:hypothetical protein